MKYTVQRMCSINDGGCDDNNNDNNEDIHSFGWRCAKGSSVFCKTILLPETGEVAPAGSSKKAGSRLLFFGSLGPDTWSYLNEPCLDFPKSRAWGKDFGPERWSRKQEGRNWRRNQPKRAFWSHWHHLASEKCTEYLQELSTFENCLLAPTPL